MTDTATRLRKKRTGQVGGLMCFAGIIALAMVGQWAGPVTARVQRVVDGDTLVVRYPGANRTVRPIGVDTPESVHPAEPVEHFGLEASAFTKSRLDGQTVRLVVDRTGDTVDAYGRLLRLVYLDGENFNATLIREGYGHAIRGFDYSMRREFVALENQARIQRRGLWAPRQVGLWLPRDVGGLPFRLAATRAVSRNPGTRYWGSATSAGQRRCMVNSQRRGEPTGRASAGAPIESLPRPEYRLGSDDVPPAAGRDRGQAHLSRQRGTPLRGVCQSTCFMPGRPVPSSALAVPFTGARQDYEMKAGHAASH